MKVVCLLAQLCATVYGVAGAASDPCPLGGNYCPDSKICQGNTCVWPQGTVEYQCTTLGQTCASGRACIPCYLRDSELCCRRADLLGSDPYCGERYQENHRWKTGTYCPDGKVCQKIKGVFKCQFTTPQPSCDTFGDICGLDSDRNCVQCYFLPGLCCRRRSKLGTIASECQYGGTNCPGAQTCQQTTGPDGSVTRTCV
ncbi:uncharacterized protein LOC122393617 isoform X2 [Amphibalanus amphitrite]|uniref:uncharacterized protein LOC122393617 isoform X2 n=1 Tax=Amphibalanus amphitrite TaxID=1232801 RepID=UPI001C906DC1|nr:uncharacterized protein LOC122393617 isoform X2 [Amphibalanus amphitrite]